MYISSIATALFVLVCARTSAEIIWEFGDWSPIPGRCLTCEKGRVVFLESTQGRASNKISGQESRNKRRLPKADQLSLFTSKARGQRNSNDRVQLVYLPEGSINDLRTANVARVSDRERVLLRSRRSAPLVLSPFPFSEPLDLEAAESTMTFRELSPRMPMALVAQRGKEREAYEQIQLLEAALSAQPTNVQEGELPRVFIAPTNLPPPPGYVKIPLLPNQSHIERRKTLPGTFLTSEFQQELPPGFIQVPLPEKIAELSHGIPFVDPKSNPVLRFQTQQGQQLEPHLSRGHQRASDSTKQHLFNEGHFGQDDLRTQDFSRGLLPQQQQVFQQDFGINEPQQNVFQSHQDFITGQPAQTDSRPQQHFIIDQPTQQDQLFQQNFHGDRPAQEQKSNRGSSRHKLAPDFIAIPVVQSPEQEFVKERPRQQTKPEPVVEQDSKPSVNQNPSSFVEIGSSVIQSPDSFSDFSNIPDFGNFDYTQDFDVFDNQEFERPNIIPWPKTIETPKQKTLVDPQDHLPLSATPKSLPEIQIIDRDQLIIAPVDTTKTTPFQLSPKPIKIATIPDSPVESNIIHSSKQTDTQSTITPGTIIQLSPKPVIEPEEKLEIGKPVRPNARRRLRPTTSRPTISRKRQPNLERQRLNLWTEEVLKVPRDFAPEVISTSTAEPATATTTVNPRSRFNFNRRRRPFRQEITPAPEAASNAIKVNEETSTLFPPFSVAKKLNEQNAPPENRRQEASLLRGRFGSRIRPRIRNIEDKVEDANAPAENVAVEAVPDGQEQVANPRRRRLRQRGQLQRVRGRNGRPLGKRRVVLNRVRKLNAPSDNNLNGDELQRENELRGSESAPVLFSQAPASQVTDPIAQTLDLINRKDESPKRKPEEQSDLQNEGPPNKESKIEETATLSPADNPSLDIPENIFNLLNLDKINSANVATSTVFSNPNKNQPIVKFEISPFQTDNNGYVNDKEQFSTVSSLHHSLDEFHPSVVPVEAQSLEHENRSPDSDTINVETEVTSSPFNFLLSSISQPFHFSQPEALIAPIPDTHAVTKSGGFLDTPNSQNPVKHSIPQRTDANDDGDILPYNADTLGNVSDTLSPENESILQDNFYDDFDTGEEPSNNETIFGSGARIVYAVALSEPPPNLVTDNDFTTKIPTTPELEDPESNFLKSGEELQPKMDMEEVNTVTENYLFLTTNTPQFNEVATVDTELTKDNFATDLDFVHEDFVSDSEFHIKPLETKSEPLSEKTSVTPEIVEKSSTTDHQLINEMSLYDSKLKTNTLLLSDFTTTTESAPNDFETTSESFATDGELRNDSFTTEGSSATDSHLEDNFPVAQQPEPEKVISAADSELEKQTDAETPEPIETTTESEPTPNTSIPSDGDPNLSLEPEQDLPKPTPNTTSSFLDTFFPKSRQSKNAKSELVNQGQRIIGRSTVTEVRSSAPMICIDGNCVIGTGIRKKRNS